MLHALPDLVPDRPPAFARVTRGDGQPEGWTTNDPFVVQALACLALEAQIQNGSLRRAEAALWRVWPPQSVWISDCPFRGLPAIFDA